MQFHQMQPVFQNTNLSYIFPLNRVIPSYISDVSFWIIYPGYPWLNIGQAFHFHGNRYLANNDSMIQTESDESPQNHTIYIIIGITAGLLLLLFVLFGVFVYFKRRNKGKYESDIKNVFESDEEEEMDENVEMKMINDGKTNNFQETIIEKVSAT